MISSVITLNAFFFLLYLSSSLRYRGDKGVCAEKSSLFMAGLTLVSADRRTFQRRLYIFIIKRDILNKNNTDLKKTVGDT